MNLVTRSARRDMNHHCLGNHSLAVFKANAHRAHRADVRRTLAAIANGNLDAYDADFTPNTRHVVTGHDVD